jgi:hypothetical protein
VTYRHVSHHHVSQPQCIFYASPSTPNKTKPEGGSTISKKHALKQKESEKNADSVNTTGMDFLILRVLDQGEIANSLLREKIKEN